METQIFVRTNLTQYRNLEKYWTSTVADPRFPRRDNNSKDLAPTYYFGYFLQKLHGIDKKNWTERGTYPWHPPTPHSADAAFSSKYNTSKTIMGSLLTLRLKINSAHVRWEFQPLTLQYWFIASCNSKAKCHHLHWLTDYGLHACMKPLHSEVCTCVTVCVCVAIGDPSPWTKDWEINPRTKQLSTGNWYRNTRQPIKCYQWHMYEERGAICCGINSTNWIEAQSAIKLCR